jgi:hypothetical protein
MASATDGTSSGTGGWLPVLIASCILISACSGDAPREEPTAWDEPVATINGIEVTYLEWRLALAFEEAMRSGLADQFETGVADSRLIARQHLDLIDQYGLETVALARLVDFDSRFSAAIDLGLAPPRDLDGQIAREIERWDAALREDKAEHRPPLSVLEFMLSLDDVGMRVWRDVVVPKRVSRRVPAGRSVFEELTGRSSSPFAPDALRFYLDLAEEAQVDLLDDHLSGLSAKDAVAFLRDEADLLVFSLYED